MQSIICFRATSTMYMCTYYVILTYMYTSSSIFFSCNPFRKFNQNCPRIATTIFFVELYSYKIETFDYGNFKPHSIKSMRIICKGLPPWVSGSPHCATCMGEGGGYNQRGSTLKVEWSNAAFHH